MLNKLLRVGEGRMVKRLDVIAGHVEALEDETAALTDDELRAKTGEFKERLADGETLDDLLPEAFATVREAAKRILGQRHFDVQVMGGAAVKFRADPDLVERAWHFDVDTWREGNSPDGLRSVRVVAMELTWLTP